MVCLARFDQTPFFKNFDEELQINLKKIVLKICRDSQIDAHVDEQNLGTTCYLHGTAGCGKTTAVHRLAGFLGLPIHEVNIYDLAELSRDRVKGVRGYQERVGWLKLCNSQPTVMVKATRCQTVFRCFTG